MKALGCMNDLADSHAAGVVVFPHAGGSPRFFRHWNTVIDAVPLWGVTYPGRDHRIGECPGGSLRDLAADIADELIRECGEVSGPLVLVGHSMGAWVAYETAVGVLARRTASRPSPIRLVVSGQNPPHLLPGTSFHSGSDDELIADIVRQNPESAQAWSIDEIRKVFLPAVREDYRLLETYRPTETDCATTAPAASFDITLVVGDEDHEVDRERLHEWSRYSSSPVATERIPGGHFSIAAPDLCLARIALALCGHDR